MTAEFLVDTSVLARLMRPGDVVRLGSGGRGGTARRLPITELEFFFSARSAADRAFARAWDVQTELTSTGTHRSAGPVDLVVAATAELYGLTLLHHDRDFECIARVTGQAVRWFGAA